MVEYLNISKFFDLIVASDLTQADKPHPNAFKYVVDRLGFSKLETLMVGDERANDIIGATVFGLPACYATWPKKNQGKTIDGLFCAGKPEEVLQLL
jgi:FMN phosphatase YigB (HAD superfamily)